MKSDSEKLDFIYQYIMAQNQPASEQPKPDLPFEVAEQDAGIMSWDEAMKKYDGSVDGWRLPTKDELNLIYKNRDKIPGLNLSGSHPAGWYWSSTPSYDDLAYDQRFSDGAQSDFLRNLDSSVRCVR